MVEVFVIVVQNNCKELSQNASNSSRYMVVVFVPQSFCDVVFVIFVVVVQNDCKESFTEQNERSQNECIYFFAANIYILLSNGREANLSKLSFLS